MKPRKHLRPRTTKIKPLEIKVINKHIYEEDNCLGQCWPGTRTYIIEIDPRQFPKEYMDTVIHETLHEIFPQKSEAAIVKAANTLTNVLWKLQYRRKRKPRQTARKKKRR